MRIASTLVLLALLGCATGRPDPSALPGNSAADSAGTAEGTDESELFRAHHWGLQRGKSRFFGRVQRYGDHVEAVGTWFLPYQDSRLIALERHHSDRGRFEKFVFFSPDGRRTAEMVMGMDEPALVEEAPIVVTDVIARNWSDVIVVGCEFRGVELVEMTATGAEILYCRFVECDLTGADFTDSLLGEVDFVNCTLDGARFDCTDLVAVTFERGSLWSASFDGAKLLSVRVESVAHATAAQFSVAESVRASAIPVD